MAAANGGSSRKKQDEKNLKTLRELGALSANKYCFDCNQRGPTYVDVTIGSFVCTKCSGMLRGLTPPHRVKSISMATFTNDEIDLIRNRGNDYCKNVWMGLCDANQLQFGATRDEQIVRDFMIDKYEKKRFYLDPIQMPQRTIKEKPLTTLISDPKPIRLNNGNDSNRKRPEVLKNHNNNNNTNNHGKLNGFAVNFEQADVFSSNNNGLVQTVQENFANFDDVFNSSSSNNTMQDNDDFSIFDLKFTNSGPILNQVPLFPKCNTNRWSMPASSAFDNFNLAQMNAINNKMTTSASMATVVPLNQTNQQVEDKYAALKDLDMALKTQTQQQIDWNSSGSNGSLYSSPTPTIYSSSSPQGSMFGSPNQGFATFHSNQENSNPFNGGLFNGIGNGTVPVQNPFRDSGALFPNGWGLTAVNPFKVGTTAPSNPNNPFL